jgi:hypothetical protein
MDQDQPSGNINLGQTLLGASSHSSISDQPALSVRPASTNTISSQYTAMASTVGNQAAAAVSANNSRTTLKRLSISSGFYAGCVEVVKDLIYFWIQPSAVVQASLASRRPPAVPSNAIPMFVDYEYNYTHFYLGNFFFWKKLII